MFPLSQLELLVDSPSASIWQAPPTFFSPISLDPYNQGRIACANTLSDLYAIGAHRVDTILMILSVSTTGMW